jgi:CBS domain-containing protein
MKASEFCNREVVVVDKEATVADAARVMRELHVGSVIVVETDGDSKRPVGVLTDRDIVVEFVATGLSPDDIAVGDAISYDLVTIVESEGLFETIELMRTHGVRRIPVVDDRGGLVGLVASDDALDLIAEELTDLVKLVARQRRSEARRRS